MSGTMKRECWKWSSLLLAGAVLLPSVALADGVVLRAADLGVARARIESRIAAERARSPKLFEAVAAIARSGGKASRSQRPAAIGVTLRRMGSEARWALVELVAVDGPARASLDSRSWHALQIAAVDALGTSADPELAPVLRATWERATDVEVQSAAAIGLGRLGAAELPSLLAHAVPGDPRLLPAIRGLGISRRPEAAETLARLLDGASDDTVARELTGALAEAGSSWAWATGKVGTAKEGESVRRTAAAALVRNYLRLPEAAAPEVEIALRRVDYPDTRAMVTAARASAPPAQATRLDRLLPAR